MRLLIIAVLAIQLFTISSAVLAADADNAPQQQSAVATPTNGETEIAYKQWITRINEESEQHLGKRAANKVRIEILSIQLLSCDPVANQPNTLLCRVRVESTIGDAAPEMNVAKVVMTRTGTIWSVD